MHPLNGRHARIQRRSILKPDTPSPTWIEGIDPDIDLRVAEERSEKLRTRRVIAVIAVGGMIGAATRYAVALAWPTPAITFPWTTLAINVSGCFLLGALMAYVAGHEGVHPLLRPFLGTGLLGGYTTFSTYTVEANGLLTHAHPIQGLSYLLLSVAVAMPCALAGHTLTAYQLQRGRS